MLSPFLRTIDSKTENLPDEARTMKNEGLRGGAILSTTPGVNLPIGLGQAALFLQSFSG